MDSYEYSGLKLYRSLRADRSLAKRLNSLGVSKQARRVHCNVIAASLKDLLRERVGVISLVDLDLFFARKHRGELKRERDRVLEEIDETMPQQARELGLYKERDLIAARARRNTTFARTLNDIRRKAEDLDDEMERRATMTLLRRLEVPEDTARRCVEESWDLCALFVACPHVFVRNLMLTK